MSVSSVSGNSSSLFQFLQSLQAQNQAVSTTTTASTTAKDGDEQGVQGASGHPHHHHGGGGSLISKIESAVTTALQSAPPGADPNKTIQDAITQALGGTGTTDATPTTPTATPTTDQSQQQVQAAFLQVLQSHGVSAQQFQQDIQSALQQASSSGGPLDFSKLFASFPPGSNVDTTV